MTVRPLVTATVLAALLSPVLLVAPRAEAASVSVELRGAAHCQTREAVNGVRVITGRYMHTAEFTRGLVPHVVYWQLTVSSDLFPIDARVLVRCGSVERTTPRRTISAWSTSPTSTKTTLNAICSSTACRYPVVRESIRTNSYEGSKGECTYGAAEKFLAATGIFPTSIDGNAGEWTETAAAGGWDIYRSNPVPRSVVVFAPGDYGSFEIDGRGHVGWVTRVTRTSDGVYVTFHEMNGEAGFGQWTEPPPTLKHMPGMTYIAAPAP